MITPFTYARVAMIYSSTAFSIIVVMLVLNIISIEELITILGIEPKSNEAQALKLVVSRIQEMSHNVLEIISKLLQSLFSWAGIEIDLNKIKIDTKNSSSLNQIELIKTFNKYS
ncbi:MAG: hypothetical protein ACO26G_05600 [Rickettsiales bacterium]